MRSTPYESVAAPTPHSATDPAEFNVVCRTKPDLPNQTDSNAALLLYLIHLLGSAHEWSGVWNGPKKSKDENKGKKNKQENRKKRRRIAQLINRKGCILSLIYRGREQDRRGRESVDKDTASGSRRAGFCRKREVLTLLFPPSRPTRGRGS